MKRRTLLLIYAIFMFTASTALGVLSLFIPEIDASGIAFIALMMAVGYFVSLLGFYLYKTGEV